MWNSAPPARRERAYRAVLGEGGKSRLRLVLEGRYERRLYSGGT